MTEASMRSSGHASAAEQAVAADQQRIALELAHAVIRNLFDVGLYLPSALPGVSGVAEQTVIAAIEGIDRIIGTIRSVVLDLAMVG